MTFHSSCPVMPGDALSIPAPAMLAITLTVAALLNLSAISPAAAQALRSPSANSLAAGPTADRNSVSTPSSTGLPGVTARQSTSTGTGSGSAISILGMPLRIAAPVTSPYDETGGTGTFAGQPVTGKERVLQQSIDGAP